MAQKFFKPKEETHHHQQHHFYELNRLDMHEVRRQVFHFLLGPLIIVLYHYDILSKGAILAVLAIGCFLAAAVSRMKIPILSFMLRMFDRKGARFPGEGAVFYVMGCYIVLALFPEKIAMAGIMVLAAGDSFSTIVGKKYGRKKIGLKKTLEGTLAGFIAGFFGAYFFVSAAMAFFGSIVAMTLEAIELKFFGKTIDDNLFIPIIASLAMQGVARL